MSRDADAVTSPWEIDDPVLGHGRFRVTVQDVVDASRANMRYRFLRPASLLPAAFLASVLAIVVAVTNRNAPLWTLGEPYVLLGFVLLLTRLGTYLAAPLTARRMYRQQKSLQQEYEITLTRGGLRAKTATTDNFVPWGDYLAWQETGRSMLIYQSDMLYQFMPKSAVDDSLLHTFRSLVSGLPRRR